jgi:hypothetical protein
MNSPRWVRPNGDTLRGLLQNRSGMSPAKWPKCAFSCSESAMAGSGYVTDFACELEHVTDRNRDMRDGCFLCGSLPLTSTTIAGKDPQRDRSAPAGSGHSARARPGRSEVPSGTMARLGLPASPASAMALSPVWSGAPIGEICRSRRARRCRQTLSQRWTKSLSGRIAGLAPGPAPSAVSNAALSAKLHVGRETRIPNSNSREDEVFTCLRKRGRCRHQPPSFYPRAISNNGRCG